MTFESILFWVDILISAVILFWLICIDLPKNVPKKKKKPAKQKQTWYKVIKKLFKAGSSKHFVAVRV